MISLADKKLLLLKKIQIFETKLINYEIANVESDFVYENSYSSSLLILNLVFFILFISTLKKSFVFDPEHYFTIDPSRMLEQGDVIWYSCLLIMLYSANSCYNIFYSDYYSNTSVIENLIKRADDSLAPTKGELLYKLHIFKSSILNTKDMSDIEFENILNLLDILVSKF